MIGNRNVDYRQPFVLREMQCRQYYQHNIIVWLPGHQWRAQRSFGMYFIEAEIIPLYYDNVN